MDNSKVESDPGELGRGVTEARAPYMAPLLVAHGSLVAEESGLSKLKEKESEFKLF